MKLTEKRVSTQIPLLHDYETSESRSRVERTRERVMVLVTASKPARLLYLSFIGRVAVEELGRAVTEIASVLDELSPGFRLLTDFSRLESIALNGTTEIGKVMELCDQKGVALVVRVIPEPSKDIGMNILALFHYPHRPRMVTCTSMLEAGQALSL